MSSLNDLVQPLFIDVPGAPEELLTLAYREAARRFFTRTLGWREDAAVAMSGATTNLYTLTPASSDVEVFDTTHVKRNTRPLEKRTAEQLKPFADESTSTPRVYTLTRAGLLQLAPDPGVDDSALLTVRVALRPARDATAIPDDVVDDYTEALQFGALEKLLRAPNQPWTSPQMSDYYRTLFEREIDYHRSHATDGNQVGVARAVRYGGY